MSREQDDRRRHAVSDISRFIRLNFYTATHRYVQLADTMRETERLELQSVIDELTLLYGAQYMEVVEAYRQTIERQTALEGV